MTWMTVATSESRKSPTPLPHARAMPLTVPEHTLTRFAPPKTDDEITHAR